MCLILCKGEVILFLLNLTKFISIFSAVYPTTIITKVVNPATHKVKKEGVLIKNYLKNSVRCVFKTIIVILLKINWILVSISISLQRYPEFYCKYCKRLFRWGKLIYNIDRYTVKLQNWLWYLIHALIIASYLFGNCDGA